MNELGPTVLIIDDEPALRRFVTAGFEHAKFLVRQAENAAEGLESAALKLPDLIILDLGLPDQDGADVLDQIRSWSDVPVIVLSARSDEDEKVYLSSEAPMITSSSHSECPSLWHGARPP
jgi:two-component system, OmpR family, KDP operon response regulator KdpE